MGSDAVYLARVTNANEAFTEEQLRSLESTLDQFQSEFPQLFFGVYSAALPRTMNAREFGFWLLNRAAIPSLEITRPNENGCLLILEETSGQAVMVVGYLLECYFTQTELNSILLKGQPSWEKGKLAQGTLEVIAAFSKALKGKSREAMRNPAKFSPIPAEEPAMPEFTRLHDLRPDTNAKAPAENAAKPKPTMKLKPKKRR